MLEEKRGTMARSQKRVKELQLVQYCWNTEYVVQNDRCDWAIQIFVCCAKVSLVPC